VQMRTEIKELHQRLEATIVYVTHDQIEAMTMADKIVVLHDGAVEQIGAPLDLYDRPRNLFVAGFIGSPAMNFMNGRVARENGDAIFVGEGGARLAIGQNAADGDGRPITVGIRPEHFAIDFERGAPAEIIVVEPTGSETMVFARYMGREIVAVFRDRIDARPGSVIKLSAPPERVHLFDAGSGQTLG
jgi:multiple sugar transport system ATP-binding protein